MYTKETSLSVKKKAIYLEFRDCLFVTQRND